jgi:hypothetical protein
MKASTPVMTLDGFWTVTVLHSEIISDSSGTVPDEIERSGESATGKQVVKQIVQRSLKRPVVMSADKRKR